MNISMILFLLLRISSAPQINRVVKSYCMKGYHSGGVNVYFLYMMVLKVKGRSVVVTDYTCNKLWDVENVRHRKGDEKHEK